MNYLLAALSFALHTLFWGAGLARIILPGRWRRWWWAFAPGLGWSLQSASIWFAANAGWAGTNSYGMVIELIPALLLGWALSKGRRGWGVSWRGLVAAMILAAAAGWLLIAPMRIVSRGLSAVSLGSCDHADYAAGARVLAEFSKNDRVGFLDLPEVTRVAGAERFFEYWLRLNHFTPAALLAHHGSVFGYEGWQIVSVLTAMLAVLNVPLVLLFTRAVFALRGAGAIAVAALYAVSPLCAYGVHHGAMGQFLATQGVLLAFFAARGGSWRWLPLAGAAVWLLAGSYNFILVVAFAPAAGWLIWRAVFRKQWHAAVRGGGVLVAAVGICGVFFWGRFAGIVERFELLDRHDFGWPVPLLGPVGWLGAVQDHDLTELPPVMAGLLAALLLGLAAVWVWRYRIRVLGPLAVVAPLLIGYLLLVAKAGDSANASYNAYKFLAVFLPVFLAGSLGWLAVLPMGRFATGTLSGGVVLLLLFANLRVQADFRGEVAKAQLIVTPELRDLRKLESDARVYSLNMRIDNFWARMWANTFLLKKPQYFVTHSYEARKDTELRGEWDLSDSLLQVWPMNQEDGVVLNGRLQATRAGAAGTLQAVFHSGWHAAESDGRMTRWRWTDGSGLIRLRNPSPQAWPGWLSLKLRSAIPGDVEVSLNGQSMALVKLSADRIETVSTDLIIPTGESELRIANKNPGERGPLHDARVLGAALYQFELRVLRPDSK